MVPLLTLLITTFCYSTPHAVFEKVEIDAGDVWRGDKPHYVYKIKNTGDAPLEVFAKPNCGCAVANFDRIVQPGDSGKIDVELNTASFRGRILKTVDVTTNDPEKPLTVARIVANVKSIVSIQPPDYTLITLKTRLTTVYELEVALADTSPVELTKLSASAPYVHVQFRQKEGMPGHYAVTVSVQPDAPMGRSAFTLLAQTGSLREPEFTITCLCAKGILTTPPSAYLGSIDSSTSIPVRQTVTLLRRDGQFRIKRASTDDANLQVTEEMIEAGKAYRLTLIYKGGWPAGLQRHKVTVETDDPDQPSIDIPVLANIAPPAPGNNKQ